MEFEKIAPEGVSIIFSAFQVVTRCCLKSLYLEFIFSPISPF